MLTGTNCIKVGFPVTSHADELREDMVPQMDILATKKRK
jgi:hypothetical protein